MELAELKDKLNATHKLMEESNRYHTRVIFIPHIETLVVADHGRRSCKSRNECKMKRSVQWRLKVRASYFLFFTRRFKTFTLDGIYEVS